MLNTPGTDDFVNTREPYPEVSLSVYGDRFVA